MLDVYTFYSFLSYCICVLFLFHSFCLKGEALDGKSSAVIDYTPYLKFTQRYIHWQYRENYFNSQYPNILIFEMTKCIMRSRGMFRLVCA